MEKLIDIWIFLGYFVYWVGLIGSAAILETEPIFSLVIGLFLWIVWVIVLQILYWINKDGWILINNYRMKIEYEI